MHLWNLKITTITLLISSGASWGDCTSMTAGTGGVSDLVCDGKDLVNAGNSKWLVVYYRATPGQIATGSQLSAHTASGSSLGGGVYQQTYSQSGVPFLEIRMTPSISTGNLVIPIEIENVDATDTICPIADMLTMVWSGAVVRDGGYTRSRYYPGTSLPVRLYDDGTTAMAAIWSDNIELGELTAAVSSTLMRLGTTDTGGNGFCVNPGETRSISIEFRFGPTGATVASLAPEALASYRATYSNGFPDRRPIGAVFLASTGSRSANNPRGWISTLTSDLNNPSYSTKLASFQANLLTLADTTLANLAAGSAQGVVIWDVEGQELDHASSYVCDPTLVDTMAPEMAGVVDAFMAKFTSAGYRVGNCIRPTQILAQSGAVSGACDWLLPRSGGVNAPGYNSKMSISVSVPYTGTPYYCRSDGNYYPRDTTVASVDATANTVTLVGDYFFNNDFIVLTGTVPSGLTSGTVYYVVNKTGAAIQFSATAGGSAIDLTSTGSGTIVATAPRDQLNLQYAAAYQSLRSKVAYARTRWGSTLFYIDTINVLGLGEIPSKLIADLVAEFPDCVFFPEILSGGEGGEGMWGASLPFKSSALYSFYFVPTTFYSAAAGFQGASVYPASFNYLAGVPNSDGVFTSNRTNIEKGFSQGSIGVFRAWFGEEYQPIAAAMTAAGLANKTLAMTDSGSGRSRVFAATPATSFTYPLFMRVYFAATVDGLGASTSWCQQQSVASCFLSGIRQATASLNLSALPYYQLRYYDFAGNLVSNPGTYGLLQ